MSDTELATLSTIAWLVATVALFILLAGWSTGSSWGLTAALVRGVRSWSDRPEPSVRTSTSPAAEALAPLLLPPLRSPATHHAPAPGAVPVPLAEIEDLWTRRLYRQQREP